MEKNIVVVDVFLSGAIIQKQKKKKKKEKKKQNMSFKFCFVKSMEYIKLIFEVNYAALCLYCTYDINTMISKNIQYTNIFQTQHILSLSLLRFN